MCNAVIFRIFFFPSVESVALGVDFGLGWASQSVDWPQFTQACVATPDRKLLSFCSFPDPPPQGRPGLA